MGFYSDDWFLLSFFSLPPNLSLAEQLEPLAALSSRPLHNLHAVLLFRAFGTAPLGYHAVNMLVSILSVLLFHACLRELRTPRSVAITVPLLYGLMPQYSTVRFWISANAANLSMALYFLSLYCALRAIRAKRPAMWGWGAGSVASLVASGLTYEVAVPLFLGNVMLLAWTSGLLRRSGTREARAAAWLIALTAVALTAIVAYKLVTTDRPLVGEGFLKRARWVVESAVSINFLGPNGWGLGLPRAAARALSDHPDVLRSGAAALFGLAIFFYLRPAFRNDANPAGGKGLALTLIGAGMGAFALGYAMAFVTPEVGFSKTGMNNRTAIAAAPGVALAFGGAGIGVGHLFRRNRRAPAGIALGISLFCALAFLINNTLASFWVDAYTRQKQILTGLTKRFPVLPRGSVLILDGACPYVGPGVVFECHWEWGARCSWRTSTRPCAETSRRAGSPWASEVSKRTSIRRRAGHGRRSRLILCAIAARSTATGRSSSFTTPSLGAFATSRTWRARNGTFATEAA